MKELEIIRDNCLAREMVTESFPFGEGTLVFKVNEKIFAILSLQKSYFNISLKCNPERACELREAYPNTILPGYHLNKKHWNTISFEIEEISLSLVVELIEHSYCLVVTKK